MLASSRCDVVMVLKWLFSKSKTNLPRGYKSSIDPEALKIVEKLQRAGHKTFLVGGCVRDILLGKHPKDFDIATSATPNQVKSLIHRSFVIGRRFRIVVAKRRHYKQPIDERSEIHIHFPTPIERLAEKEFQITTFRREPEKVNEQINENVFGSAEEDALRRDFTINALFLDPRHDELVDYVQGLRDISQKKLRIIGDPSLRFKEDPIRILRAIRFQCRTAFQFESKTKNALISSAGGLADAKRERVREEFLKGLREGHILDFFSKISSLKIWDHISPTFGQLFIQDQKHGSFYKTLSGVLAGLPWNRPIQSPLIFLSCSPLILDAQLANEKSLQKVFEDLKISRSEAEDVHRITMTLKRLAKDPNATQAARTLRPIVKFYENDCQAFFCLKVLAKCNVSPFKDLWRHWAPHWHAHVAKVKSESTKAIHEHRRSSPNTSGRKRKRYRRHRSPPHPRTT